MSDPFIHPSLIAAGVNDQRSRDFVAALSDQLEGFHTSALLIQDPRTVDVALLPIMTIELGMTEFMTAGLKEAHVRELLARAPEIHAWTGTVYGTRRALGALGISVDWTQWWQMQPMGQHDTHTVVAYINQHLFDGEDALLTETTQYAVLRLIQATQRWSQDISFKLGLGLKSGAGLAAAFQDTAAIRRVVEPKHPMPSMAAGFAAAVETAVGVRRTVQPESPYPGVRAGVFAALSNAQYLRVTMEVAA